MPRSCAITCVSVGAMVAVTINAGVSEIVGVRDGAGVALIAGRGVAVIVGSGGVGLHDGNNTTIQNMTRCKDFMESP